MSKQVIVYNEATDAVKFAPVEADTFALAEKADGTYESMTYNEWEALRCKQACEKVVAGLQVDDVAKRAQISDALNEFSATMQQKYLEGNRSWVQLFELLAKDFVALS